MTGDGKTKKTIDGAGISNLLSPSHQLSVAGRKNDQVWLFFYFYYFSSPIPTQLTLTQMSLMSLLQAGPWQLIEVSHFQDQGPHLFRANTIKFLDKTLAI